MPTDPALARAWFLQRETGARQLEEIERAALASLDAQTALRQTDALLAATPPATRPTSGLCEQQRMFARARR